MTCREIEENLGAYALDAVTPEEREAIEAHLAQCANCTRKLQELRAVVALLPLSVQQVAPSAALKERIMAQIREERTGAPVLPTGPTPVPLRRRRRPNLVTQLLAAAAILLLVLFGGMTVWNTSLQAQASSLEQQVASLQHQLSNVSQNPTTYAIRGSNISSLAAIGQVIYLPQQHLTVLVIHGLPHLRGTEVYQGWLIQGKQPKSIGLLSVQNGIASIDYPGKLTSYSAAAISMEPGPAASVAPTTVVAVGSLTQSA